MSVQNSRRRPGAVGAAARSQLAKTTGLERFKWKGGTDGGGLSSRRPSSGVRLLFLQRPPAPAAPSARAVSKIERFRRGAPLGMTGREFLEGVRRAL